MQDKTRANRHRPHLFQKKTITKAVALSCGAALPLPAAAVAELEEVLVTATKREQSVQEIPYNISAFSSEFLQANKITDLNEVSRMVPGLSFIDQGPGNVAGDNRLILRGLNANGANFTGTFVNNTVAPVSTYLGETPLFFPMNFNDLKRVEVLRGPQGTLYGSGSLGGTVRFIPNEPELEESFFSLDADASFTEDADDPNYGFSAVFNLPLAERTALRIGAGHEQDAGFIDAKGLVARDGEGFFEGIPIPSQPGNPFSGYVLQPTVEDVNESENWYLRGALKFAATENIELLLSYHHEETDSDASQTANPNFAGATIDPSDTMIPGSPGVNVAGCPGGCFGPAAATTFPATGDNESTKLMLDPSERELDLYTLEAQVDLGFASLTSATSYYEKEQTDYTHGVGVWWAPRGLAAPNLLSFYGFYPRMTVPLSKTMQEEGLTQELRLVSTWDKNWDYIVGIFYQDLDFAAETDQFFPGINDFLLSAFGFTGANPQLGDRDFTFDKSFDFEETAFFGEVTYHVSERLQLTLGARVFQQDFSTSLFQQLPVCGFFCANDGVDPLGTTAVSNSADFEDEIFKANASYQINEDTMAYFTWAEGFRRGGANNVPIAGLFGSLPQYSLFEPDQSTNWELGIKGTLQDRFTYTAAIYLMQWDDFQFDTSSPPGFPYVVNGKEAESRGLEIEFSGRITDRLSFMVGYAYTDAEVTESFTLEDAAIAGLFTDPPTITEVTRVNDGDELPGVFEHSAAWAIDYLMPLNNSYDISFHLNGSYRGSTTSTFPLANQGLNFYEIDSFAIWDASISIAAENWSASLFVDNLGNEQGITGGLGAGQATSIGQYRFVTRPMTFGLRVRYAPE